MSFFGANGNNPISASLGQDEINGFFRKLSKQKEDWQVDQARMAVHLYDFHKSRSEQGRKDAAPAAG